MDESSDGVPSAESEPTGEPGRDESIEFVKREIESWREAGIVSGGLARRLLARYDPEEPDEPPPAHEDGWPRLKIPLSPGMVLLYLGGLLIVTAASMLASDVWDDLGAVGQLALVAVPTIALFAAAAWLQQNRPARVSTALVLALVGCLMAPFALALVLRVALGVGGSIDGVWWVLISLLTLLVHLTALWRFRSPLLTIPYPISALWVAFNTLEAISDADYKIKALGVTMVLLGLVLIRVGLSARNAGKPAYALMPDIFGSLCFLAGVWGTGKEYNAMWMDAVALAVSVGAMWASVHWRNQTYLIMGALFVIISIFSLGFGLFEGTVGLPLTLIICGGLSMGVGYAVQQLRREHLAGPARE